MLVLHTQNMVRMETHLLQSKSPLSHICDVSYLIFAGGVPTAIALKLFGLRYIKIISTDEATQEKPLQKNFETHLWFEKTIV